MNNNKCWTVFTPSKCYFLPSSSSCFQGNALKEITTKGMIGSVDHQDELFILDTVRSCRFEDSSSVYSCVNKSRVPRIDNSRIDLILLWHRRLGHPNFLYLKRVKPDLFHGIPLNCLKCETCLYGKQVKAQYLAKLYEARRPFNLIHSDI